MKIRRLPDVRENGLLFRGKCKKNEVLSLNYREVANHILTLRVVSRSAPGENHYLVSDKFPVN
jgi:hypothetical protein